MHRADQERRGWACTSASPATDGPPRLRAHISATPRTPIPPPDLSSPAIRTQALTRRFGSICAVDDLTFEVAAGSIFGLLGHNGAGKTTTIRLLLGLLDPTSGHAEVLGFDSRREGRRIRERTGALLEHSGLYERLTAEDNLTFYARVWRISRSARKARIRELLTQVGLWERRREPVGRWSRGMRQKLAVARTLLHRPTLVFLDEPTAGLDPVAAASLRADLSALAANEGTTIFLTTHNLREAEQLCKRLAVLRGGRLLASGTPHEIRARAGSSRVTIRAHGVTGAVLDRLARSPDVHTWDWEAPSAELAVELSNGGGVAPVVRLLVEAGVGIEEVRRGSNDLEEAFLRLMDEES